MLYNKTDIRIIIAPIIKVPNTINVIGIEKYLVSLKIEIKFIPNMMLVKIRINPVSYTHLTLPTTPYV